MMVLAGGWFWIHSRNFSLVTTINHFFHACPNSIFNFHTWDCSCEHSVGRSCTYVHTGHCSFEHSVGMYSYFWKWRMSINAAKWTCLIFCFYVPSLWPPFIPFPLSLFAHLEPTLLGMKDSWIHTSRFPEACVSEKPPESSEPYVTLDSSKFRWTEPHSEFILLSSQVHTWEYLVFSRIFRVYLKNFRLTDTLCRETRNKLGDELFLEIFS